MVEVQLRFVILQHASRFTWTFRGTRKHDFRKNSI